MLSVLRSQSNRQSRHLSTTAAAAADGKIEDSDVAVVDDGKTNSQRTAMAHRRSAENCLPKDKSEPAVNNLQPQLIGCYFNFYPIVLLHSMIGRWHHAVVILSVCLSVTLLM